MKQTIKALLLVLLVSVLAFTMIACDFDFGTIDVVYTFDDAQGNVTRLAIKGGETLTEELLPEAPAAPNEGEYFLGWFTEDGTEIKAGDVAPEGPKVIDAHAVYGYTTVSFLLGEQTIQKIVKPGTALVESDFPATYIPEDTRFIGWYVGETKVEAGYVVENDVRIVAVYEPITVSIEFQYEGGSETAVFNLNAIMTEADFPEISVPEHQQFVGWFVNGEKVSAGYKVTADTLFTAVFEDITYNVVFDMNGAKTVLTYTEGAAIAANDFPAVVEPENKIFVGWYAGETKVEAGYIITADQTIAAVFADAASSTLTFVVNGFKSSVDFFVGYALTDADFPSIAGAIPAHQTFLGWYAGAERVTAGYVVTADVTVTAMFVQITHNITFNVNGVQTSKEFDEGKILSAQDLAAPAAPEHQKFVGWFIGENKIEAGYEVVDDVTIVANFEDILCTVTFVVGENETSVIVKEGTVLTAEDLTAPEAPAHMEFAGWSVNGRPVGAGYEVLSDVALVASFREIVYTVTFVENGEESVREFKEGATLAAKDFPTYTIPAHTTFLGWFVGDEQIGEGYAVNANVIIEARFQDITFTVTFVIGETENPQTAKEGTLIALPDEEEIVVPPHTTFGGWFIGDEQVTEAFELVEDVTLTARFIPVPQYVITFVVRENSSEVTFYEGDVLTAEDFPEVLVGENEDFEGWFIDMDPVAAGYVVEGPVTIVAAIENRGETPVIQLVDLTFVVGNTETVKTVANGSTLGAILFTPTATPGLRFEGWKNAAGEFVTAEDVVNGAATLTASFVDDLYYVTFVMGEDQVRVSVAIGYAIDAAQIPVAPEKEDAEFVGFFDANDVAFNSATVYDADVTFTAKYITSYYYVDFYSEGVKFATVKVLIAEGVLPSIPDDVVADGKIFVGYFTATDVPVVAGMTVAGDFNAYAKFVTFPEGAIGTWYYGVKTVVITSGSLSLAGEAADEIVYDGDSFLLLIGEDVYEFTAVEGGYELNGVRLVAELPAEGEPETPIIDVTGLPQETPLVGIN